MKRQDCARVGMASWLHRLDASASEPELLDLIAQLNADPAVHGILVQLPLPAHFNEERIIRAMRMIASG